MAATALMFDVLDGKAKVLTECGDDWTAGMVAGAWEMLRVAQEADIELTIAGISQD